MPACKQHTQEPQSIIISIKVSIHQEQGLMCVTVNNKQEEKSILQKIILTKNQQHHYY